MLMMRPFFFSIMIPATAFVHSNAVFRFRLMTRSHSSSEISVIGARRSNPPAPLTRISTVSQRSTTALTIAVTSFDRVTSAWSTSADPPAASIPAPTRCASGRLISTTATPAPSRAKVFAIASPSPWPAAVTMAVKPESLPVAAISISCLWKIKNHATTHTACITVLVSDVRQFVVERDDVGTVPLSPALGDFGGQRLRIQAEQRQRTIEACAQRKHQPHVLVMNRQMADRRQELLVDHTVALLVHGLGKRRGFLEHLQRLQRVQPRLLCQRKALGERH